MPVVPLPVLTLGLDAGGTATRWCLRRTDGTLAAEGQGRPMSGHLFNQPVREKSLAALDELLPQIRAAGQPQAVCAGITGLAAGGEAARLYAQRLAEGLGLDLNRVQVADDMWIAYHGLFEPGEGVLIYCGTGSVGYHVTTAGAIERSGGHGYILDDGGSAFWIAREGVKAVMRAVDEQGAAGWQTPLGQGLAALAGGARWDLVRSIIYGGDRGSIAEMAPFVAQAAAAGDLIALDVLTRAGHELARLALVLAGRLGPRPVGMLGGGFRLHPLLAATVRHKLPADMPVVTKLHPAVETAARLATALL
jgi:N-acetylglucosamine kinase-like BadF-type ATPase